MVIKWYLSPVPVLEHTDLGALGRNMGEPLTVTSNDQLSKFLILSLALLVLVPSGEWLSLTDTTLILYN